MTTCWVVHYGEIGIKGDNRFLFERRLADNIKTALGGRGVRIAAEYGRLVVSATLDEALARERLSRLPGIVHFAAATSVPHDPQRIREEAVRLAVAAHGERPARSFRVDTRRSNKSFPLKSVELNREVGAALATATSIPVDLGHAELTVWIEIAQHEALLYTRKHEGVGGLPVGAAGRVVVLLSGGIDSPVAAFKLIRRGAEPLLLHFHNYTRHEQQVRAKIVDLATVLAGYQLGTRLWLVPFAEVQEALLAAVPAKARMVAYRRAMLRIAETVAGSEHAMALVTGDSVGQVASQTLENLHAAYAAVRLPVLTPLIGDDKNEIVAAARRIGSYDISTRPYQDCCSFLVARHPDTRTHLASLEEAEARIPFEALAKSALDRAERLEIPCPGLTSATPGP